MASSYAKIRLASDNAKAQHEAHATKRRRTVSDQGPKWDEPGNEQSSKTDEIGDFARAHGISVDRAQMLFDRLGHDPAKLKEEIERLISKDVKRPPQPKGAGFSIV